ncbi:response regulator [Candidatus Saccharibacteria bacterium]|jgi:DNA-binding response OmpR family regulator|nr:response regulator [Candidatus Saccharibacteria bacterium]MBP9131994.1 response regulator [Candidatus Saccharibacteria bacterium]
MAKLLLVEDDNNLREIYSARLSAEGYEIVTAADGEEALAVAVKERPDLIVLDVMMPKISGFGVLDILRSTPETRDAKIMMMTALSQDSDRERGKQLGVDKYIVKSQVTLEDVVDNVAELLQQATPPAPVINNAAPAEAPLNVPGLPLEVTEPQQQVAPVATEVQQQQQSVVPQTQEPTAIPAVVEPIMQIAPEPTPYQAPAAEPVQLQEPAISTNAPVQEEGQVQNNDLPFDPPAQDQAVQQQPQVVQDDNGIATPPAVGQVFQPSATSNDDQLIQQ